MDTWRERLGTWLVRMGHRLLGMTERVGETSYAWVNGEQTALCRFCGAPTQTASRTCWRCSKVTFA